MDEKTPARIAILLRLRGASPSVAYDPLLARALTRDSVLETAVRRQEDWYSLPCAVVVDADDATNRRSSSFVQRSYFSRAQVDVDACLEAMNALGLAEAVLCYPELAWCHDTVIPIPLPAGVGCAAHSNGYRSVVLTERQTLESLVTAISTVGLGAGTLQGLAGFVERLASDATHGFGAKRLPTTLPWISRPGVVLADEKSARSFLAEADTVGEGPVPSQRIPGERRRPNRVLFVCGTSGHSGAEEMMLRIASALHERGIRTGLSVPLEGVLSNRFRSHGGRVFCDNVAQADATPENVRYFEQLLQTESIDVMHCTGPAGLAPMIAASVCHCPSLYHIHCLFFEHLRPEFEWSTCVIACSEIVRECLIANGIRPSRVRVVHNCIGQDLEWEASTDDHIDVVSLARYSREKRHDLLLTAIRILSDDMPDVRVLLIGDDSGPSTTRQQVLATIRALRLESIVRAERYRPDAAQFLKHAKALLLTSDTEAAPLVVLEAMAAGIAVVAPRLPAIEAMVGSTAAAVLFEPGNARSCAAALKRVLDDPLLRAGLARAGRTLVERDFSADRCASEMTDVMGYAVSARNTLEPDERGVAIWP